MATSETAWQASIDYEALGKAADKKAHMARVRGARSAIRTAGYRTEVLCQKQEQALSIAQEITKASGVPMRIDEVVIGLWPA